MRRLSTSSVVKTILFRLILFVGQHVINQTMKMILLFSIKMMEDFPEILKIMTVILFNNYYFLMKMIGKHNTLFRQTTLSDLLYLIEFCSVVY